MCGVDQIHYRASGFDCLLSFSMHYYKRLFWLVFLAGRCDGTTMLRSANTHLPPHLQELCSILARGLLRLRSRTTETVSSETTGTGDFCLHSSPRQRGHANPRQQRHA